MTSEEGDGGVPIDATALSLIHRFRHSVQTGSAQQFHKSGLQKGDLLRGHHIGVLRGVHIAGSLLHFLKDLLLAADHAHHNVLLAAVAAKAVSTGFGSVLIQQERGMTGMGHAEGAVIPKR